MIQFDAKKVTQHKLLETVIALESSIEYSTDIKIPCREIHLPVVFDHPDIRASEKRYMETNRPTAAYLPDDVEYLRTNNGYSTRQEVFQTLLNSPYLIVAVGFFVGTPILFPLEPMSGIVGQKYNPTRVSTPGGTIGMGGSLFAIYPLEAPGGYMLFWDTFGNGPSFTPTRPWLFEPFDIVRYHEVSVAEYDQLMLSYKRGELEKKLYGEWVAEQEAEKKRDAERVKEMMESEPSITIDSPIDANVWKVLVEVGDVLKGGQVVAILEAMKMEINVVCTEEAVGAVVEAIASKPGSVVTPGTWIVVAKVDEK
jgi:urea carboxylase